MPDDFLKVADTLFVEDASRHDWQGQPLPALQPKKNTVLVSHGRPPWYAEDGRRISDAFVIGVAGVSACCRHTHVAREIVRKLGSIPTVVILSQDSFYKFHNEEELALARANMLDFDHPDAIDMPMFASCLADLKACKQSNIPVEKYLYGATIIIAEGIMSLVDPALRALYDLKVFVQCDSDLMLARRIKRDINERGRDVTGILDQYLRHVKPSYDNFVRPSATYAELQIVPGSNNEVAIDLICTHIQRQLHERTGIYTILRDKTTSRQDFIFFIDLDVEAIGKKLGAQYVCGISILRSGGALERGFRRVINDVPVGSLLIQSDSKSGEAMLLQVMLPFYVRFRHLAEEAYVFLLMPRGYKGEGNPEGKGRKVWVMKPGMGQIGDRYYL
ncbi:uridine kinase family-domain-containing protein [Flammula alnicola]|nr:uridine kinase family-domain-containing protein [Flammula alnicola]